MRVRRGITHKSGGGKETAHTRSASGRALDAQRRTVAGQNGLDDRETETRTLDARGAGARRAIETLAEAWEIDGVDAGALVRDRETSALPVVRPGHAHLARRTAELEGVVDEIPERGDELEFLTEDPIRRSSAVDDEASANT